MLLSITVKNHCDSICVWVVEVTLSRSRETAGSSLRALLRWDMAREKSWMQLGVALERAPKSTALGEREGKMSSRQMGVQRGAPSSGRENPPTLAGRSGSVSSGVTALFLVLVHTGFCMCAPRVESVFPSPVEVWQSNPAGLQTQIPWGFLGPLQDPQARKLDVGLTTLTTV